MGCNTFSPNHLGYEGILRKYFLIGKYQNLSYSEGYVERGVRGGGGWRGSGLIGDLIET